MSGLEADRPPPSAPLPGEARGAGAAVPLREGGAGETPPLGERAPELGEGQEAILAAAIERVEAALSSQLPRWAFRSRIFRRPVYGRTGMVDPLPLLELGGEEKLHRRLDYVLVVVGNELTPRTRIFVTGVPASALEVAALSLARFRELERAEERLAALALHLLGHLLGLGHSESGVMAETGEPDELSLASFSPRECERIGARLAAVADARVEERSLTAGTLPFLWQTVAANLSSIFRDIQGNAPWRMPLHLGRYTAATAVTVIFLFLSAEAWELGAHLRPLGLGVTAVTVVLLATASLYVGQNFHQMGRVATLREQLVRTRVVMLGSLLLGVGSLWVVLFLIGLGTMSLFPREVFQAWAGVEAGGLSLARYAAFMATLGVVAGAFGGNLEDEAEIKAVLLFDEET